MTDAASSTLILSIPGTQETQELSRTAVLAAIGRGEIGPNHWVWSPAHNDWKQVAEIPELQVQPAVMPVIPKEPVPVAMSAYFPGAARQVPETARKAAPTSQKAKAAGLSDTQQPARTTYSRPMEIKHEFPIFKILFVISFLVVAALAGTNYFLVDQPLETALAETSFGSAPVYAHLAAFTQPRALVIHILPSKEITADNFADFLAALAKSTPPQPFNPKPFDGVGLTSAWQSQYVMNGTDWQKLGQMAGARSEDKKKFEIEHLVRMDGSPLVNIRQGDDPAAVTDAENKAWQALLTNFLPKAP